MRLGSVVRGALGVLAAATFTTAQAFDLQAHRGARGLAPENTLPAFALALSLGVTTLELDTAITKDGVVVISHDSRLNPDFTRGPDDTWLTGPGPVIQSMTYTELMSYDVGRLNPSTGYGKRYPLQKPVDGTRIPKLGDLFALVDKSGNTQVRFNIETKIDPRAPERGRAERYRAGLSARAPPPLLSVPRGDSTPAPAGARPSHIRRLEPRPRPDQSVPLWSS